METLGDQPAVIAQGRQMKNFVPVGVFLRRNPHLAAIQTAIAETVAGGHALVRTIPTTDKVVRTEPVQMSDGCIHAVHVWCGPADAEPPERPIPGPAKWDLTDQSVIDTAEALTNAGMDPAVEALEGRSYADDFPVREYNHDENEVLARTVSQQPGHTYVTTWEFVDKSGMFRRLGVAGRGLLETMADGSEHVIGRGVNLVIGVSEPACRPGNLAKRIIDGLSQPGLYRSIVDLKTWTVLKWLDEPCPYFDSRQRVGMHPEDWQRCSRRMIEELQQGSTCAVVRLPDKAGEWVPVHVTLAQVELEPDVYGGLVTLRLPTDDELAEVGLARPDRVAG